MHELKIVSWALVSWANEENSFRENSFRKHSYGEKKNRGHSFRKQTKKTRFVSTRENPFWWQFQESRDQKYSRVCSQGVFFLSLRNSKMPAKTIFYPFPRIFEGNFLFLRPLVNPFFTFFTSTFYTGTLFFFRYQNHFHGHLFYFFHEQNLNEHQTPYQQKILIILTWKKSAITLG